MAEQPAEKGRWPFDPMQPGDHEPVRLPENPPPKDEKEKNP
jgi:hypothetical protein